MPAPPIRIRKAEASDLPHVRDCLAIAFELYRADYTPAMFENTVPTLEGLHNRAADMIIWVACFPDGEVVGTIAAAVIGCNVGHLRGMAVRPGHHGAGVAAELLQAAESELRSLGCTTVTLDTTPPLHRAMKFYEKHGYRQSGTRHAKLGMELIEHRKDL